MDLKCTNSNISHKAVHGSALTPVLSNYYPSSKLHVVLGMRIETNTHTLSCFSVRRILISIISGKTGTKLHTETPSSYLAERKM